MFFYPNCVFPHFVLHLGYTYNLQRHTCVGVVGIAGVVDVVGVVGVVVAVGVVGVVAVVGVVGVVVVVGVVHVVVVVYCFICMTATFYSIAKAYSN